MFLDKMDFGFYGKGIDGYAHYMVTINHIDEEEKTRRERNANFDHLDNDDGSDDDFDDGLDNFDDI